ncbi:hypothetical protein ACJX0J_018490, partial [Zea mays]
MYHLLILCCPHKVPFGGLSNCYVQFHHVSSQYFHSSILPGVEETCYGIEKQDNIHTPLEDFMCNKWQDNMNMIQQLNAIGRRYRGRESGIDPVNVVAEEIDLWI